MPVLYRICGKTYLPQDPSGAARSSEGRWHVIGQRVLYLSSSLALCVLELRANGVSFQSIRERHHYSAVEVPSLTGDAPPLAFYEGNWAAGKAASQQAGNTWYRHGRSLLLTVRSAVLACESNTLAHAEHPAFGALQFSAPMTIPLDPRLG